jgi:hypothetical protein
MRPYTKLLLPLLLLPLLLLLPGCATSSPPPVFQDPQTRFPGLADLAAQSPGRASDVLLVHGICSHDAAWAGQVVAQLAAAIVVNGSLPGAPPARPSAADAAANLGDVEVVPAFIDTPYGNLRFDALIWSPLTAPLKQQLCYDQTNKSALCAGSPPYTPTRARLNATGKDGLVDDCLADALIYQGVARDAIRQRMRAAILRTLPDQAAADAPLVVIAHSMGSKILFDTLLMMSEEAVDSPAARVARQTVDRMRFLVMAANQIPLLSLADQQITVAASTLRPSVVQPADSLQLLLQRRLERWGAAAGARQAAANLTLVAFTDPNDLLSYTLPAERYARGGVAVFNILVSNAPTYLGLLERPDDAHLNYLTNPDVARLIACGQPASALCKPR